MTTGELAQNPNGSPVCSASSGADEANRDLLSALAGKQGARERAVGESTRRVVMASLGVMRDQEAGRKRSRSLALACLVLVLLIFGPFAWRFAEDLINGQMFGDVATQISLWACILCSALFAAFVVAGWSRRKP